MIMSNLSKDPQTNLLEYFPKISQNIFKKYLEIFFLKSSQTNFKKTQNIFSKNPLKNYFKKSLEIFKKCKNFCTCSPH